MKMRFVMYLIVISIILLAGCSEEITSNPGNVGNMQGSVFARVDTGLIPLENVEADLMGTGQVIMSNSAGQFFFSNIPPGTFDLNCTWSGMSLVVKDVKVVAGLTAIVPEVVYDRPHWNTSMFKPVEVVYELGVDHQGLTAHDINFIDLGKTGMDSVTIQAFLKPEFYLPEYRDTSISILMDSDVIYTASDKGMVYNRFPQKNGLVDFALWQGNSMEPTDGSFQCELYILQRIDTEIVLHWENSRGDMSAGDLDILLVNNNSNDTCWFRNPEPDWGIVGKADDNPVLDDEANVLGLPAASEELKMNWTPEGDYTLLVKYHSNPSNPLSVIRPDVSITIGGTLTDHQSPVWLNAGDVWTVLSFTSPSGDITFIDTVSKTDWMMTVK